MTPEQKLLVRTSFAQVAPISDVAARLFYERLFYLDPSLRSLFKHDMEEQGRMLMQMISTAVANLDRLDTLVPAVQSLGARHARYGVLDSHYNTVGEALIWTLEQGLGDAFTLETKEAWIVVYTLLSSTMKDAASAEMVPA
jgi:hemoglobin-like flavoprotein